LPLFEIHVKQEAQVLLRKSRSYSAVWNSRGACWQRQFQRWNFGEEQCGFNLFVRWHRRLWFKCWGVNRGHGQYMGL